MGTTARTMVTDALKEIGVVAEGETPSGTMADDAFRALNRLMESLSNDKEFSYQNDTTSYVVTNLASFTIGPTGNLVGLRPIEPIFVHVDVAGISYPIKILDMAKWDAIGYKSAKGAIPEAVYYEPSMPNGTMYIWPIPTSATTMVMRSSVLVNSFASLDTALSMPPGYEEALIKTLAVNISPQYPVTLSPITVRAAQAAMKRIYQSNNLIPTLDIDENLFRYRSSNLASILRG